MKRMVALAVALTFGIMSASFGTIEVFAAAKTMEKAVVKAGEVNGKVMDAAGSPVVGATVTLTDMTGTVVTSTTTGTTGCYGGLVVNPGSYVIAFDGKISAPIDVRTDGEVSDLSVVLPDGDYSAGQDDPRNKKWLKVAGGIALIAGAAWAFNELFLDDDSKCETQ